MEWSSGVLDIGEVQIRYWISNMADAMKALMTIMSNAPLLGILINRYEQLQ